MRPLALLLLLLAAVPAWAQTYKCVDERGVTHYTDKPRPGCSSKPVDIRPIPPVSGKESPGSSSLAGEDAEFRRRQIQREEAEAREKAALQQRCARLRREQSWLSHGGRITQSDAEGRRAFVDDGARDARLAQVNEQLRVCP